MSKSKTIPKVHCSFTRMVPLEELVSNPRNPKRHPESQIDLLAKIISVQGWRNPIVVSNRSGFITKGHARLEAARKLELKEAPVDFQDYKDEATEWADMLADIDGPTLKDILQDLDTGAFDMDLTGYDPRSIEELMTELHIPGTGNTDPDQIPSKIPARCKKGDVWKLGDHRLLCGDVTDLSATDKLMAGAQAHMVWTDPPYGVKYGNKLEANNAQHYKVRKIENDNLSPDQLEEFLRSALINMAVQCVVGAPIYVACPAGDMLPVMIAAFSDSGFKFHWQLVWLKDQLVLGRGDYHFRHENILYGWKDNGAHYFTKDRKQDSIFDVPRPKASEDHPTMKPVELVERMIQNSSLVGQIVLDPFGGSGSTMIACQTQGRKCYMMELEEHYCDVIIRRWEEFTGKQSEKIK